MKPNTKSVILLIVCAVFSEMGLVWGQQPSMAPRQFAPGTLKQLEQLPPGRARTQIEGLPEPAKKRALAWLQSFHFTDNDLVSLHADPEGGIFYADGFALEPARDSTDQAPVTSEASVPISPFPAGLIFHSRPGAPNIIYINFTGKEVTGTAWNTSLGRTSIPAVPFSTDADYTTFSDSEQAAIKRIWQRMAEDYSSFNCDVTTERPATFTTRTAEALITRNTDTNGLANPSSTAGGVAYVNVFANSSYASYRPAWIYANNLGNSESYIAEAASHEIGHNMGLSHDGKTDGSDYYGGHGSGDTSWGPIMGTGYNRNVSQWSKGEYYLANNTQDDLATVAAKISYRADDHGNSTGSATGLVITGGTNVVSTTPENDPANGNRSNKGVIESNTDVDVFSFVSGNGPVDLAVNPWITPTGTRGGNLDVSLELFNQAGTLISTNNPATQTLARIQGNLTEGIYYLYVRNSGCGDPMLSTPSGYTSYASIGQYFISGKVTASGYTPPPLAELQVTGVTQADQGANQFTVTYSDNLGINTSTIDSNDIRITGPNGYARSAQLISIDVASSGTPRVVTYAAAPPTGSSWTPADNGTYTIWMQTNQVGDTEGMWVAAGQLGEFSVSIQVPFYTANMSVHPGWTLESQWQYGAPSYSSSGPSAGFTGPNILGYNLSGNYPNNLPWAYATTLPVNCSGSSSVTLRFRRWLRLRSNDSALIQVSTNGTTWLNVWSTSGTVSDSAWQEMRYTLPSGIGGSSSVRLRWGIASDGNRTEIGWNIDDVELFGDGNLDTTPPVPTLEAANITMAGSPSHSFSVTCTDNTAVRVACLGSTDLVVTGPNGYSNLVEFVGADLISDGTPRTATYSAPAPNGQWNAADNGVYQVTLQDGEIEDTFNNTTPQMVLGTFTVAIPASQQALVVSPTSITVPESSNAVFMVCLAEQPASPITVTVNWSSGDTNLFVQAGATNQFNSANWSTPVPVTIAATADDDREAGVAAFECRAQGLTSISVVATEQDTTSSNVVLTICLNNPGWGTVTPTNGTYPANSALQVVATPAPYYCFTQWTGDVSKTNNPLVLMLNTNLLVNAMFSPMLTTNQPTPYWWLAAQGFSNNFEAAVNMTGSNGIPLWQSYIAGLNPNDPKSQLRLEGQPAFNGTNLVLHWNTVTNRVYSVLASTNLASGFVPLPGATNLPWTVQSFTNHIDSTLRPKFYRIEVREPL